MLREQLAERRIDLDSQIEAYRPNAVSQVDVDTIVATLDDFYTASNETLLPLADAGDSVGFAAYFRETVDVLISDAIDAIQVETAAQGEEASALAAATDDLAARSILLTFLVAALGAVVATGLAYVVARGISRRIGAVSASLAAVGDGDLTVSSGVTGRDELGRLAVDLERTQANLRELIAGACRPRRPSPPRPPRSGRAPPGPPRARTRARPRPAWSRRRRSRCRRTCGRWLRVPRRWGRRSGRSRRTRTRRRRSRT
ncbi:HAMP domain-containing protein, partial [Cellulosimicrobium sp. CUA-896]|uniref:HAMP domain-containing protein n=1 Tax=Cellulosimicrobium sp. CUA-896 TaxID=1517881 RepID=UPI0011150A77